MSLFSLRSLPVLIFSLFISCQALAQTSDVGEVTFPNSGKPETQDSFLRGLALLHNFEYEDAAENFQRAEQIDPDFVMAYWGEAMTKNHPIWMEQDRDAAIAILNRLAPTQEARIAKAATDREKDYLEAIEVLYGTGAKNDRDFAYADAMQKLHQKYPDDTDASAFYALALLGTAHEGRDFRIYMQAAAILEDLFCDHPKHPGVVHYLIHSYDDPIHAPLGLRAAQVYSKIAPSAAHAQHMTSHIFVALGMWDEVVAANETAMTVVNNARKKKSMPPRACGHYNFWLEYGYLQQGRKEDAKKLLKECFETANAAAARTENASMPGMLDPDNSSLGSFVQMWSRYLLDTSLWNSEVTKWVVPLGKQYGAQITYEFVTGFGAVKRGDLPEARKALEKMKENHHLLVVSEKKGDESELSYPKRAEILEDQLQGLILAAEGKDSDAILLLRHAIANEESLPVEFGPPFVDKPSHELLGDLFSQMKRPKEAITQYELELERAPNRTSSLFGLAVATARAGDREKSNEIYNKLRKIWQKSDEKPDDTRLLE